MEHNKSIGLGDVFGSLMGLVATTAVRGSKAVDGGFDLLESGLNTSNNLVSTGESHSASFKELSEMKLKAKKAILKEEIKEEYKTYNFS